MRRKPVLGKKIDYRSKYSPDLLHTIPRKNNRQILDIGAKLPFHGEDIWNAYELTWLNAKNKPQVMTAEFRIPADSPNIIESKSMKLYLNSLSMKQYQEPDCVKTAIITDLTQVAGAPVGVQFYPLATSRSITELPGNCIDNLDIECSSNDIDPGLLRCSTDGIVFTELHSHLLRSHCPITNQPDSGSILIRYKGRQIDCSSLLQYLVAYRNHHDFHESCVERIFVDIKKQIQPEQLTVYARYNRRGGLDINPFRSDYESTIPNLRLWRQ